MARPDDIGERCPDGPCAIPGAARDIRAQIAKLALLAAAFVLQSCTTENRLQLSPAQAYSLFELKECRDPALVPRIFPDELVAPVGLSGFTCTEDGKLNRESTSLLQRAVAPCEGDSGTASCEEEPRAVRMSIIVDFLELEGTPQCEPYGLLQWCGRNDSCTPMLQHRFCKDMDLESYISDRQADRLDLEQVQGFIGTELARECLPSWTVDTLSLQTWLIRELLNEPVTDDAPDGRVVVRMVATRERCAEIEARPDGENLVLEGQDTLLGCSLSCPVSLDESQSRVQLVGIDGTDCDGRSVELCASMRLPTPGRKP